jgi:hypothetical protein
MGAFVRDDFNTGAPDTDINGRSGGYTTYTKLTGTNWNGGTGAIDIDASGQIREETVTITGYTHNGETVYPGVESTRLI